MKITFKGWPWQLVGNHWASNVDGTVGRKYGWNPFNVSGMGRFGGGWAFKFGIDASRSLDDFVIYLGIGQVRIKL